MWNDAGQTLTTPGPDISFNTGGASDDYFLVPDECSWTPDLRVEAEDAPRTHGSIVWPVLKGAGHLRLGGRLKPVTDTATARDAMAYALEAACDSLLNGNTGTYSHPARGALTVTCEVYPGFGGPFRKTFVLVLIAADPTQW